MGVLAVDVHESLAEFAHLRDRHGRGVDPGAAAALDVDRAAQDDGVGLVESGRGEPLFHARGHVEFGAHLGALGAFADQARVAARAEHELERVDENGFARAGFTGQTRQPRRGLGRKRRDNHEILKR